jgi:hypothetical protein
MRTLSEDEPLNSVWDEMVFTESRLEGDERTKEYAPLVAGLVERLDAARSGQLRARRDEVAAQAAVAAADNLLDDWVRAFDRTLADVVRGDKQAPRYKRYFTNPMWTYVRMGLESELSQVRGWSASLASEPEQSLKDHGTRLAALIAAGDAALEQRRVAISARSDHRARVLTSLVDDINATRGSLYGNLVSKGAQAGMPSDWPSRFFKHAIRIPKSDEPAPAAAPAK